MSQAQSLQQALLAAINHCGGLHINRGIEREALRIEPQGRLAQNDHPPSLGAALTHPLITTDYAESLLEFITPVCHSIEELFGRLNDIHQFSVSNIGEQALWPVSMPCHLGTDGEIKIAHFGTSNVGKMKHTYRQGLHHRYGSTMQIIAGVHYNFSLPDAFWQSWHEQSQSPLSLQDFISERYMGLIRNFYRYGWLVAYLYGASPALCDSFLNSMSSKRDDFAFKKLGKGTLYLDHATSLRLSDLGYTSPEQSALRVNYNSVGEYVDSVRFAVNLESQAFAAIGVEHEGEYRQLNTHVLQIENELYAPIRAKRVTRSGQTPSQALAEGGVEYIEVRALDINPFNPLGVSEDQVRVIDTLLLSCLMMPSAPMSQQELQHCRHNFNLVAVNGRSPQLTLSIGDDEALLSEHVERLFAQMSDAAKLLDMGHAEASFSQSLAQTRTQLLEQGPLSAQWLKHLQDNQLDAGQYAQMLAKQYREHLLSAPLRYWQKHDFEQMSAQSHTQQAAIEQADTLSFKEYLERYFSDAQA